MKTIGLLGGMSWESTLEYYRIINRRVQRLLGGLHSAEILLYSLDFHQIEILQRANEWQRLSVIMVQGARRLQDAGADFLVMATNTMHKLADDIESNLSIPLLHIADATAAEIRKQGLNRIGLLGTRFTMEEDFYRGRLTGRHDLEVMLPKQEDRDLIHGVIYGELCRGVVRGDSEREFYRIISELSRAGAQGIILGCTELSMLVKPAGYAIPLFDTTEIHARRAAESALETSD
ncbi:MAG TPA: aspartate/glutamate racemase family protein [Bacteroidetes bacterium]|nr:aspartate/glutamate racemase family protein [Bacteroidota bacterium]